MQHEITGFEHLHRHTDFSVLDGYAMVEEYAEYSKAANQQYLCITDHGMMGAIPRQIQACEDNGLFPLFGCELYLNSQQPDVPIGQSTGEFIKGMGEDDKKRFRKSCHLLAIAHNEVGYKNLVQLTSWGWLHGFYYKPRVNYEQLTKYKEGITFCSGCYNCEIGYTFDTKEKDEAMDVVRKYHEMFGEHFYLEMMLLDFDKQKPYNAFLVEAHKKFGIPLVLTNDCHYCKEEDSFMQRVMLMIQTGKTLAEIQEQISEGRAGELFELQDQNLFMKTEDEINKKWEEKYSDVIDYELFKEAKRNTVRICEKAKGVQLDRSLKLPVIDCANDKLRQYVMEGFKKRGLPTNQLYLDRIREELGLICSKEFASYFLIEKMMTDEARRYCAEKYGTDGTEAVGPGRGSGVGALTNYLLGITDVNPILHDLLFSRFMSPARGGKSIRLRFSGNYDPPKPKEPEFEPAAQIVDNSIAPWEEQ